MPCIHENKGCKWNGDIINLSLHLLTCEYDLIPCPNKECQKQVANVALEEHLNVFCLAMPRTCRLCGETFSGKSHAEHSEVCTQFPVPCPNSCSVGCVARGQMEEHVTHECTSVLTSCFLKQIGCRYEGSVANVNKHIDTYIKEHFLLISGVMAQQTAQLEKLNLENELLRAENKELKIKFKQNSESQKTMLNEVQDEVAVLRTRLNQLHQEKTEIVYIDVNGEYVWKIEDFEDKMSLARLKADGYTHNSPVFYSHVGGYKLKGKIRPIESKSWGTVLRGQHLSVLLCLLVGNNDESLEWPFPYSITMTVVDQSCSENPKHVEYTVFPTSDNVKKYFQKPHSDDIGVGYEMIPHALLPNYITDNAIIVKFKLTKII